MRYSILFLLLLINISVFSQDSFHRYYKHNGGNSVNLDALELNGGNFISVDGMFDDSDTSFQSLLFTIFDNKGIIQGTFTYELDMSDSTEFSLDGNISLVQAESDSIFFTTIINTDTTSNRLTVGLSSDGQLAWSKIISIADEVTWNKGNFVHLADNIGRSLYEVYNGFFETDTSIILHSISTAGDVNFTKKYSVKIEGNEDTTAAPILFGFDIGPDTNSVLMTGVNSADLSFFMTSLDTLGAVNFSKSYRDTTINGEIRVYAPKNIVMADDGSFAVAGDYIYINLLNIFASKVGGFVSKHDTLGNVLWAKGLDVNNGFYNEIYDIHLNSDGSVFGGGMYDIGEEVEIFVPFSFIINSDGSPRLAAQYMRGEAIFHVGGGSAFGIENGGFGMFIPGYFGGTDTLSIFLKLAADLTTPCSDTLDANIFFNIPLDNDTLLWNVEDIDTVSLMDTLIIYENYSGYAVPDLSLATRPWCPNEPIDWTFDAKSDGAVSYEWSDGSMGDTLRVFEEGTYSVIVTIDDGLSCYILCDTTDVGRLEEPMVNVTLSPGNFCTNDMMTVTSTFIPGAPLVSTEWSTGETNVTSIEVGEEINITVKVTDECGESATGDVQVIFPNLIDNVSIDADFSNFCSSFFGVLTPIADGAISTTTWTPLGNAQTLAITEPGEYGVTVTDFCRNERTATISVQPDNFPELVDDFEFVTSADNFCSDGLVTLGLNIIGNPSSIEWSNGSNDNSIDVPPGAQYSALLRDDCKTISKDITIDPIELSCIKFPKLIIPQSENEDNRMFGGFTDQCPTSDYTGYELYVFNRWGQEVFSTTSIEDRWDGRINGDLAPPDVYVWHAKYNDGECELEDKGDVTLFR